MLNEPLVPPWVSRTLKKWGKIREYTYARIYYVLYIIFINEGKKTNLCGGTKFPVWNLISKNASFACVRSFFGNKRVSRSCATTSLLTYLAPYISGSMEFIRSNRVHLADLARPIILDDAFQPESHWTYSFFTN